MIFYLRNIFILILSFFAFSCTFYLKENSPEPIKSGNEKEENESINEKNQLHQNASFLGSGDIIEITVYGEKELSGIYQISPEGMIIFPFIGEMNVLNMTTFKLALKITEELKKGYIKNPNVTVMVKEYRSKRVFVLGQVNNPGAFFIRDEMGIVEAIALAGGLTRLADSKNVVVTRLSFNNQEKKFTVDVESIVKGNSEKFILKPGDTIFVPERYF